MSQPTSPTSFDRLLQSLRAIIRAEFPQSTYAGIYEYSIQSSSGTTVNIDPVDTSIPLPSIPNVELRPSILGATVTSPIFPGTKCLVSFINKDPTRPFIFSIAGPPASAAITAGFQVATEHVMTLEATVMLMYNFLSGIVGVIPGVPAVLTTTAMTAALSVYTNPTYVPPPLAIPQATFAATLQPQFVTGAISTTPLAAWVPLIAAALLAKVPNASGLFPNLGAPNIKTG